MWGRWDEHEVEHMIHRDNVEDVHIKHGHHFCANLYLDLGL